MRPLYETANDLSNEKDVCNHITSKWKLTASKLPIAYQLDYWLEGQGKRAVAEIKCRKNEKDRFPTYMLSVHKWFEGVRYADMGIPFLLFVRFTDGIWYYLYSSTTSVDYAMGGRSIDRDGQDKEPCVYIPLKDFKKL